MILRSPLLRRIRMFLIRHVQKDTAWWRILYFIYSLGMPRLPKASISSTLEIYASKTKNVFFVYIGANEGVQDDILRRYITQERWAGILVEPVPHIFERLKENYHGFGNLTFENVAISNKEETRPFYIPRKDGREVLSSLSLDVILSSPRSNLQGTDDLTVRKVRCVTLDSLLAKHNVEKVDLILIDTEGSDYDILKSIDFSRITPAIVIYERNNLSFGDYKESALYLRGAGYRVFEDSNNVMAVANRITSDVTQN